MQRWGTMFIYGVTNSTGLVRVRNFQQNQLPDSEALECENLDDVTIGTAGCFGCQLHCRHRYVIKEGPYAGTYAEGPEYTTQGAFGAEQGCTDFNTVLAGNHLVNDYGLELVDADLKRGRAPWTLRVIVDTPEGDGRVPVEECARVSREIGSHLDAADLIPAHYTLEVSSPGLDRVLAREKDFESACGAEVRIETRAPLGGRRRFRGRLLGFESATARVLVDGSEVY